jgi:peptidoglycan hydrolase CwlO-like protein
MNIKNILMFLLLFTVSFAGMVVCSEEVDLSEKSPKEKGLEDKRKEYRELESRYEENINREKELRKEVIELRKDRWKIADEMTTVFNCIEQLEEEIKKLEKEFAEDTTNIVGRGKK